MHYSHLFHGEINLRLDFIKKLHTQNERNTTIKKLKAANKMVLPKNDSQLNNAYGLNNFTIGKSDLGNTFTGRHIQLTLLGKLQGHKISRCTRVK